jgi:hypothetical protein
VDRPPPTAIRLETLPSASIRFQTDNKRFQRAIFLGLCDLFCNFALRGGPIRPHKKNEFLGKLCYALSTLILSLKYLKVKLPPTPINPNPKCILSTKVSLNSTQAYPVQGVGFSQQGMQQKSPSHPESFREGLFVYSAKCLAAGLFKYSLVKWKFINTCDCYF